MQQQKKILGKLHNYFFGKYCKVLILYSWLFIEQCNAECWGSAVNCSLHWLMFVQEQWKWSDYLWVLLCYSSVTTFYRPPAIDCTVYMEQYAVYNIHSVECSLCGCVEPNMFPLCHVLLYSGRSKPARLAKASTNFFEKDLNILH